MERMTPRRVQLSRRRGYRKPEGAVVVARPSRWGNPFAVGQDREIVLFPDSRWVPPLGGTVTPRDRREAVELYRLSVLGKDGRVVFHSPSTPDVADIVRELGGKDLACWCPLAQPCHADVLLAIANEEGQTDG
ncbi:DUF4326 domain-containing protein [Microbacterium sp. H6]|uniref:DUF4326 domain-containing protein n=1 Tax=Microbacterium sp. H6 TaxID=421122 RepID=UPI001C68B77A|nr:DUF4326 domain-containing protein [Microbacterium sp. H6]